MMNCRLGSTIVVRGAALGPGSCTGISETGNLSPPVWCRRRGGCSSKCLLSPYGRDTSCRGTWRNTNGARCRPVSSKITHAGWVCDRPSSFLAAHHSHHLPRQRSRFVAAGDYDVTDNLDALCDFHHLGPCW